MQGDAKVQHLIRYFDDPISLTRREIGHEFERSFDEALARAAKRSFELRAKFGVHAGYRIEDLTGRTVMIGPGRKDIATQP
jgi:hypothetical protein